MNLQDALSLQKAQAWLVALPEASVAVRGLAWVIALLIGLGVGYPLMLAPMQRALDQAGQTRHADEQRQQRLLAELGTLAQVRRDSHLLRDKLARCCSDTRDSAAYWQHLTGLAGKPGLHLSAFRSGEEKREALLAASTAHLSVSGNSRAVLDLVRTVLIGAELLQAESLSLRRAGNGRVTLDLSLRHHRSLAVPAGAMQRVSLPRSAESGSQRDLFAAPVALAAKPRRDEALALQQSLQGYRMIASIIDTQQAWALLEVPNSGTRRVGVGDAVGTGVITHIDDRRISIASGAARNQMMIGQP